MLRRLGSAFAFLVMLCSAQPACAQAGSTFFAAGGPVTLTFNSAGVSAPFGGSIGAGQTYFFYLLDPAAVPTRLLASYLPAEGPGLVIEGVPPGIYTAPLGSFASGAALRFGVYSTFGNFWQYVASLELPTFPGAVSVRFEARDPDTDAAGFFDVSLSGIDRFTGVVAVVPELPTGALLLVGLLTAAGPAARRRRARS